MNNKVNYDSKNLPPKLIGKILLEADLISPAQLELALADQHNFFLLKLGEILALRGWLKKETVDFLVEKILNAQPNNSHNSRQPIGQYFQQSGLLTDEQVELILQEQKKLNIKFGYLAVLKGFLKGKTLNFFLDKVLEKSEINTFTQTTTYREEKEISETLIYSAQDIPTNSASLEKQDSYDITLSSNSGQEEILIFESDAEEVMIEEIVITPTKTIKINSQENKIVYNGDIAYSPIWIDA